MNLALVLVTLTGLNGQSILVNPEEVTSVREPRDVNAGHLAPGTKCVLVMSGDGMISLGESCALAAEKLGVVK